MINFIGVDDDKNFLKIIEKEVSRAAKYKDIKFNIVLFSEYDQHFKEYISSPHIGRNIYIFDIETPQADGIEVLRHIRKQDKESIAILISGFEETYATRIIKDTLNVFTFVSKKDSFSKEIFNKVGLAIEYANEACYLEFQDSYKKYLLKKDEIVYITAELRRSKIYLSNGKTVYVHKTLRFLLEKLGSSFIYSHRSCIVNSKMVETIDKSKRLIYFKNGMQTDYVSRNFLKYYNMI